MKNKEIQRYNFAAESRVVYSGLFEKSGLFGGYCLRKALELKKRAISDMYGIPIEMIEVSTTLKN